MVTNPDHSDTLSALRRIEGQVRLNQIAAVKGALGTVEKRILERHFQHCVKNAMNSQSETDTSEKISEIMDLINKRIS
jgi:DNA-binding FrmR family transcriptional regulator